ncbi:SprT family protein [Fictibacillus sp. WQ 8-8]|uniref:SprT family protein n=1 Tax=unclassified Fictibacillus TaxID=2644029 RepID=UPI0006A7C07E|nr:MULTISPECIES: SprT family protein [unclassified Fictibacillus]MCQ6268348.1 SprT family protein [Fictibacillus sp. WQ 8-8]MED2972284.1 SprT family protein [Fictibacillus sp. B-59209]
MEQKDLQHLVEHLSQDFFQKRFRHTARFNARLRTTGGRYLLRSHDIEINPRQLTEFGYEALVGIIKHELCHYHLHIEGRGYKHRDPEFKQLLKKVGGLRYCEALPGARTTQPYKYLYICSNCKQQYKRKRRVNTAKYVCGKCRGKLILT